MPKGQKECVCGKIVGCRTLICPHCQHNFDIKSKKDNTNTNTNTNNVKQLSSRGRGRKVCECGCICGVRTKTCPQCNKQFHFQSNFFKEQNGHINWKELERGDLFRVFGGSGPYWFIENNGEKVKHYIGYRGLYKVRVLDDYGIHAFSRNKHEAGHCYIYMGEEKKSGQGWIKAPHRIAKVIKKVGEK